MSVVSNHITKIITITSTNKNVKNLLSRNNFKNTHRDHNNLPGDEVRERYQKHKKSVLRPLSLVYIQKIALAITSIYKQIKSL